MNLFIMTFFLIFSLASFAQTEAHFKVLKGTLHKKGTVVAKILPDPKKYDVLLEFEVKKKSLVPVPASLLKGSKTYEFPLDFRKEDGYKKLEKEKELTIHKAVLKFVKREDIEDLKGAYFIQVLPTNKKTKIDIIYHPSLPSVGWLNVTITFISNYPILDGYELKAELIR
jgi:hypothetical protein